MTLQGSWVWYELVTPDAAGAKAFYEAVVGWTVQPGSAATSGYGFIAAPDGGMTAGVLTLTDEMKAHGARPGWLGYIGVDDVDATVAAIVAAGGACLMPASDIEMAGRIAMVADAGGAPFYIMTPKMPEGGGTSTAFSTVLPGRCAWNELMAGDAAAALAFYTGQFGWTLPEPMDMGEYGKYHFIAHDGGEIGAITGLMPGMSVSHWNFYFTVPSVATAAEAIGAGGGKVVNGPMAVPNGSWIVQGIDPQGAFFCLVGNK